MTLPRLITKNSDMPLLETLDDGCENGIERKISHLDSKVLRASGGILIVLQIEAADVYINNSTKSTAVGKTRNGP